MLLDYVGDGSGGSFVDIGGWTVCFETMVFCLMDMDEALDWLRVITDIQTLESFRLLGFGCWIKGQADGNETS